MCTRGFSDKRDDTKRESDVFCSAIPEQKDVQFLMKGMLEKRPVAVLSMDSFAYFSLQFTSSTHIHHQEE